LGSSRHLVVGADSATAAIMFAGITSLGVSGLQPATPQWVVLAGLSALLAGGLLWLARVARLGLLADFLSRTVLVGFLTGVGIQVATGQVGGMLQYLPNAVLSSVVFLIGVKLIAVKGMRAIYDLRRDEFWVALLTAATVIVFGVEQGIILAIVLSLIVHVKRHFTPHDTVVRFDEQGHLRLAAPAPGTVTEPGLVIYRFPVGIFYANAVRLSEDAMRLVNVPDPPRWFVLFAEAIDDIDYTGAQTLLELAGELRQRGIVFAVAEADDDVRRELDRFGLTDKIGPDRCFDSLQGARDAFHNA
jgi:sulfate permease, SulP family